MAEKISFEKKLSRFRDILNTMDWSPDGTNAKQGYQYNVSKALVNSGLEWDIQYRNLQILGPIGNMGQHYILEGVATITDIDDPSFYKTYSAFGEAADSGDKGISKAQTNALKNVLSNNSLLSFYNPLEEEIMEISDSLLAEGMSGYKVRKEVAKNTVLSKNPVLDKAAEIPKTIDKKASDEVKQPKEAKEEQKKEVPKTEVVMAPAEPKPAIGKGISTTQATAMSKIVDKATVVDESELMDFGTLEEISIEYSKVTASNDPKLAADFINRYKGVMTLH